MSRLSDRVRPGVEAAPWVVEAIRKLEAEVTSSAAQRQDLLEALKDLHSQVRAFCETEGEADFETGRAAEVISRVEGSAS